MAVYSTQLGFVHTLTATPTTVYTVPVGARTILKCVVSLNRFAGVNVIALEVLRAGSVIFTAKRYMTAAGAQGDCDTWLPWIVLNAGDAIRLSAGQTSLETVLSGSQLAL